MKHEIRVLQRETKTIEERLSTLEDHMRRAEALLALPCTCEALVAGYIATGIAPQLPCPRHEQSLVNVALVLLLALKWKVTK
jgi:hypothetical protein